MGRGHNDELRMSRQPFYVLADSDDIDAGSQYGHRYLGFLSSPNFRAGWCVFGVLQAHVVNCVWTPFLFFLASSKWINRTCVRIMDQLSHCRLVSFHCDLN